MGEIGFSHGLGGSLIVNLSIAGQVTTNRGPGLIDVAGTGHVRLRANLPDGRMEELKDLELDLVTNKECKQGVIPIDWKGSAQFVIQGPSDLVSYVACTVDAFGSVTGCDGWSFNKTEKIRIRFINAAGKTLGAEIEIAEVIR